MTPRFVLDAWAVLAFLQKEEPAAGRVRQLLEEAALEQTFLAFEDKKVRRLEGRSFL